MTRHREDWQKDYTSRMIDAAAADVCQGVKNALNPKMPNHRFPKLKKRKTMKTSTQFFKARVKDGKLLLPGSQRRGGIRFDPIPMAEGVRFSGKIVDYCTVSLEADAWYVCFTVRLPGSQRRGGIRFDPIPMAEGVRFSGKIVDYCTVSLEADAWYVCFTVRLDDADRELVMFRRGHDVDRSGLPVIGVDVNIRHFDFNLTSLERGGDYDQVSTLTDELLEQYERVKYYNRSLARKRVKNPGRWETSKSYRRTRTKLGKTYRRIYALQDEIINGFVRLLRDRASVVVIEDLDTSKMFMNKSLCKSLQRALFGRFKTRVQQALVGSLRDRASVVVIEDLDTSKMFMNKSLCKSLQRALFGRFKTRVQQALVGSGVILVMADRYYPSTQRCSACGFVKTGGDRLGLAGDAHGRGHDEFECDACGFKAGRDVNAVAQRCSACGFVKTGGDRLGLAGDAHGRGHDEFECDACGFKAGRDVNAVANLVAYGEAVLADSSLPMSYKE